MYVKNSLTFLWHFPIEIKNKKEIRKWPDLPWANSQEKSAISYVGDVASHSSDCEMSYKILSHENEENESEESRDGSREGEGQEVFPDPGPVQILVHQERHKAKSCKRKKGLH